MNLDEKMIEIELRVYQRMCVGCPTEKFCHDDCSFCDDFELEALNECEKEGKKNGKQ